ncbi:Hypothetical predicted protein [Mytilus galloprovincialis]|uniref:G-protein coupled receptors family 1 profile domain-containing protein n=1 Tax=Mytilus galloprovincialis TaxID=29158 RepID=A0A8B6FYD3_MYTGA|nr:Hypothetical predicted protein [Mytilus galloprovincialis]
MPSQMQNSSVEDVLQQYTQNVTVNVVLLSLYLVTGVLGNTIVLLVYKLKMKVISEERYFIPALALSDLVSSTVCSLYGILWKATWDPPTPCMFYIVLSRPCKITEPVNVFSDSANVLDRLRESFGPIP